jgi:hypothetical protein
MDNTWNPGTTSVLGDADGAAEVCATDALDGGVPAGGEDEPTVPQPVRARAATAVTPAAALAMPRTCRGVESFITVTSRHWTVS